MALLGMDAAARMAAAMLAIGLATSACGDDDASASDETGSDGHEGDDDSGSGLESGGSGDTGDPSACSEVSVGAAPLLRLTREHYAHAVRDLLGLDVDVAALGADEAVGAFAANGAAAPSSALIQQYRVLAEELALAAVPTFATLVPCEPTAAGCIDAFVRAFGRRAFRRALDDAEVARFLALADAGSNPTDGIRLVVSAMLQSPSFLYHVELAPAGMSDEIVELGGDEIAARLSFFLWSSVPDDELLDAAVAGDLADAAGVRLQAERMLDDVRARDAVASFHRQWLALAEIDTASKDPAVYPLFDEQLRAAMWEETRRFVQLVVLDGDAKLDTLLTAPWSYIDGPLFELYGVDTPVDHVAGQPVQLDADERGGLLTHASFLATHAHPDQSGPVQRGVVVLSNVLCMPPLPPPPDIDVVPPDPDPNATTREQFAQHSADPACAGCHTRIDGLGLGFESYDGIGAHRTSENGKPIDDSGVLVGTDVDGPFVGAVELGQRLADSQVVEHCFTRQYFRFALGRNEHDDDACTIEALEQSFSESDADVRELLLAIVTSDAFRHRAPQ